MIFRVFRATIRPGKVDEFRDMLERLSVPMVKAAKGMLGFYVGEPLDPALPEYTVTTIWQRRSTRSAEQKNLDDDAS